MPLKYVFFDLDGTLTDSQEGIINAIAYSLGRIGVPLPQREELLGFIGPPLTYSYKTFLGLDGETAENAVRIFREYYGRQGLYENRVYPGIPELLAELKGRGLVSAVATSKPERFASKIIGHFGLDKYISTVSGAGDDETHDAKSEVIERALERLGVTDRSEVVMVGDRHHDADGAAKCGIPCVGVLYGFGSRQELEGAGVVAVAETPAALLPIVCGAK